MDTQTIRKQKEDEYFARKEFDRRKKLLDEEHQALKKKEKEDLKKLHWMRCPKCGMEMIEIDVAGVHVDKCSSCLGYYLDNGELEQIVEKKNTGFLNRLGKLFKD